MSPKCPTSDFCAEVCVFSPPAHLLPLVWHKFFVHNDGYDKIIFIQTPILMPMENQLQWKSVLNAFAFYTNLFLILLDNLTYNNNAPL